MSDEAQSAGGATESAGAAEGTVMTPAGQTPEAQGTANNGAGIAAEASAQETSAGKQAGGEESESGKKEDNTDGQSEAWKLTAPEGMETYQADFDSFGSEMGDWLKANPEATAQDALAEAANRQARMVAEMQSDGIKAFEKQVSEWETAAKKDGDIGGDKFEENVAVALKGLEAVGDPDLKRLLNDSGFGSHPSFIKAFHKIGKLVSDAGVVGSPRSMGGDSLAVRYPSSAGKS